MQRVRDLVSIVVPNYNNQNYLRECLDSLVHQTYKHYEIIVVDDGSTDDSDRVITDWSREQGLDGETFLYYRLPHNVKQPGCSTTGMFLARGEFIAFQASDDLSDPKRIEKQVQYLREHTDVDLLGTSYAAFEDGNFEGRVSATWIALGREEIQHRYALESHCICDGTVMIRGHVFDKLGGWTRKWESVSDFELISRYAKHVIAENLPEELYYYRYHANQTTQKVARGEGW